MVLQTSLIYQQGIICQDWYSGLEVTWKQPTVVKSTSRTIKTVRWFSAWSLLWTLCAIYPWLRTTCPCCNWHRKQKVVLGPRKNVEKLRGIEGPLETAATFRNRGEYIKATEGCSKKDAISIFIQALLLLFACFLSFAKLLSNINYPDGIELLL